MLSVSFPSAGLFPLAWAAFIPLLHFLLSLPSWKRTAMGHGLFAAFFFVPTLYWIPRVLIVYGGIHPILAVICLILLAAVLGLLTFPFAVLTRWTAARSQTAALVCFPGFWIASEMLRSHFPLDGFPWAPLGATQYPFTLATQVADIGGIHFLSFIVALGNAAFAAWLFERGGRLPATFLGILALTLLYGAYRLYLWTPEWTASAKTALVQADIALGGDRDHYATKYFESLPAFYQKAVEDGADWVIFSEAQNPFSYERDFYYTTFWRRQTAAYGVPLLFNSSVRDNPDDPNSPYRNSALLLDGKGRLAYRYAKMKLVPFGEYAPWKSVLSGVYPLVKEVRGFDPGESMTVGRAGNLPFAALICYESIYPLLARRAVAEGAEVLVNITNDSWFGDTAAPFQHFQLASFRSIETRRPLARCANTGITALVDPWGRSGPRLPLFEQGSLMADLSGVRGTTVYVAVGEWINMLLIGCSLAAGLLAGRGGRPKR